MAQDFPPYTQGGTNSHPNTPNDPQYNAGSSHGLEPQYRSSPQHGAARATPHMQAPNTQGQTPHGAMPYSAMRGGHEYSDDMGGGSEAVPKLGKAQWGGAVVSLALIVGLGIWGYRLMVRDASGVPVIPSMTQDARMVPEDPGGQLAVHQGLAVNSVTADGSASAPADRLVLAPQAMELDDEDQPLNETLTVSRDYASVADAAPVPENASESDAEASALAQSTNSDAPQDQLDEQEPQLAQAGETRATEETPEDTADTSAETEVEAESADATPEPNGSTVMVSSPLPQLRAQTSAASSSDSSNPADVAEDISATLNSGLSSGSELSPADIPVGTRLVQFGAFNSAEIARQEWERLSLKFEEFMDDKVRVIEVAETGGKTFYRLRAHGFADASESNRFCAALTARNAACIPVRQR